jgi:AcrR family transcriptional regulator
MSAAPTDKEDLRIRRTRHLLQQAFTQLMMEKQFQSITVQEITERAMVHRATFYDHFVDKYDLLEHAIREQFKQVLQRKLPQVFECTPDNLDVLIMATCEFLQFLSSQCVAHDKQIMGMVQTQITAQIQATVMRWIEAVGYQTQTPDLMATIASWAIYGTGVYWSQHSDVMPLSTFVTTSRPAILAALGQVA